MKRFAVIDLGTNTFHLLIASQTSEGEIIEIYSKRHFVFLKETDDNHIGKGAFHRALEAMARFKQIIDLYEVIEVRALATAGFRTSDNAHLLIQRIKREFDIDLEIISGEREANLFYEGVHLAGALGTGHSLLMDIGGGSVEFVICTQDKIDWYVSLPIGISILKNQFQHSEPITMEELHRLDQYLLECLKPVAEQLKEYTIQSLIGATGTFEIVRYATPSTQANGKYATIPRDDFEAFYQEILPLNLKQREQHVHVPENRAALLTVALHLVHVVIGLLPDLDHLVMSEYALKEGMMRELITEYRLLQNTPY